MADIERIPSVSPGWIIKPQPERKDKRPPKQKKKNIKDRRRDRDDPGGISIDEYA